MASDQPSRPWRTRHHRDRQGQREQPRLKGGESAHLLEVQRVQKKKAAKARVGAQRQNRCA